MKLHPLAPRSLRCILLSLLSLTSLGRLQAQPLIGDSWRSLSPIPTGESLGSIAMASTNTVAVGTGKTVMRSAVSSHGLGWQASKARAGADVNEDSSVAYNGSMLLLCSNDGFMKSTDSGVSWTALTTNLPTFLRVYAVAAQGSQFMALMDTGTYPNAAVSLITSTDGAAWTVVGALPGASATVTLFGYQVASSGSLYVVAGDRHDSATGQDYGEIWSTVDGTTWNNTVFTGATDATAIRDVIWSGQAFVAVGDGGSSAAAYRSTDGITWAASTGAIYANCLAKKGTTVNALMVALGEGIAATSSDDGATWLTNPTAPTLPFSPKDVLWDGTAWIAVGSNGTIFTSTSAGTSWLRRTPSGAIGDFVSIAYNGTNRYLAIDAQSYAWYSSNGTSWTKFTNQSFDGAKGVIWDGAEFVVVSQFFVWTTTDGNSWSGSGQFGPSSADPDVMTTLAYSAGKYVAIGYNFDTLAPVIYSGTAADNWIKRSVPAGVSQLNAITRAGSLWIAVGNNGIIITSPDGTTWTKRTTNAPDYHFDSVAGSGSLIVAASSGSSGDYYTSTNGTTWVRRGGSAGGGYYQFNCVTATGSSFTAIDSYGGTARNSVDGINWTSHSIQTATPIRGISWTGTEALAVGDHNTVLSSDLVPVIDFALASQSAFESGGTASIIVTLSAPTTSTVTLPLSADAASTAVVTTDYTGLPASVVFNAGELSKSFDVTLVNDATVEVDKVLKLNIAAVAGTRLGTQTSHTLTLVDDDNPPTIQFVSTAQAAPEHAGTVTVEALLSWPAPGAVTVNVIPTGTAGASDYTADTTLSFIAGERRKTFAIAISDDSTVESLETAVFTLTSPSGATLAASSTAFTLSIQDNDPTSTPGKRWTLRQPTPSGDYLRALTNTASGFVVVGAGGTVLTGDIAGQNWQRHFTGLSADVGLNAVISVGGQLIAAGDAGHVLTSPNGINWTDHLVPDATTDLYFGGIASSGTRHVVVGDRYTNSGYVPVIYGSSDGMTWTAEAPPAGLRGTLYSVAYASGTGFIAVGNQANYSTSTTTYTTLIFTSPDGKVWTDASTQLTGVALYDIVYTGSVFVACDSSKNCYVSNGSGTWTKTSTGNLGTINTVAFDGSKLIGVGTAIAASTATATAWTQTASPTTSDLTDIASYGGFVAIGGVSGIYTSSNGTAWTRTSGGFESYSSLNAATWTGTQFVAVGDNNDGTTSALICTSPDGIAWTQKANTVKKALLSVAWSGSALVAVGRAGTIASSKDGAVWTTKASGTNLDLHQVIWARNQFIAVGGHETGEDYSTGTGGSIVLTSPDGTKWTRRTVPTDHPLEGIVFTGTQYVAVGRASADSLGYNSGETEILTSPDAITWTHRSSGLMGFDLQRITCNGTVMVATHENFGILRSTDGITWAPVAWMPPAPPTAYLTELYDVVWTGTNFVTVGNSGISLNSTDGNTWTTSQTELHSDRVHGLAWNGQTLVAVGANASVQTSGPGGSLPVPVVNFASASSSVSESAGVANILVTLSGTSATKVTITYTNDAPANGLELTGANADVVMPTAALVFNPGETQKYLSIVIKPDVRDEGDEELVLHLGTVTGGATLGSTIIAHTLTLTDNDTAPSVSNPVSQLLQTGASLTLSVSTSGTTPLALQWKKNGIALPATVIGSKSANLYIHLVKIADAGDYTCTVTNAAGSATCAAAKVGVYESNGTQPEVTSLGIKPVVLTQPASSNCVCHWTKDSVDITDTPPTGITYNANKSVITIGNLASNGGVYACQVELPGVNTAPFPSGNRWGVSIVASAPVITAITTLTPGAIGQFYIHGVSGSPVTKWVAIGLPKGLSINPESGVISGYPSVSNTTPKTVTIIGTNAKGSTTIRPTIAISGLDLALIGTHTGLLARDASNSNLGGYITCTVTSIGTCTASYTIGATKYAITGAVAITGATSFRLGNPLSFFGNPTALINSKPVDISFTYDPANPTTSGATGSGRVRTTTPGGSIIDTNFETRRALTGATLAGYVGRHNFALQLATLADVGNVLIPQGYGFGSATISATGAITYAGKTGDGNVITASSPLNTDSTSPLYAALYKGTGSLAALPLFTLGGASPSYPDTTIIDTATATWSKLPDSSKTSARTYPAGWAPLALKLQGSRYNNPAPSSVVMGLTYLGLGYTNVDLTFDVEASNPTPNATLNIKPTGAIDPITYNPRSLSCAVVPADGTYSGKVDFTETLPNGVIIKRAANSYSGQIVRIFGVTPEQQGYGQVTYPLLPDINISPLPAATSTPIVTNRVTLAPQ